MTLCRRGRWTCVSVLVLGKVTVLLIVAPGVRLSSMQRLLCIRVAPRSRASSHAARVLLRAFPISGSIEAADAQYATKGSAQLLVRDAPARQAQGRAEAVPAPGSGNRPLSRRQGRARGARGPLLPSDGETVEGLGKGRPYRLIRSSRQAGQNPAVPGGRRPAAGGRSGLPAHPSVRRGLELFGAPDDGEFLRQFALLLRPQGHVRRYRPAEA